MDVVSAFIPDLQPTEPIEPREGAFHHPTVTPQLLFRLHSFPGDPRQDVPFSERLPERLAGVAFVRVQLLRTFSGSAPLAFHRGNGIDRLQRLLHLVTVGSGKESRERNAFPVDHQVTFRPLFASVGRVPSGLSAPLFIQGAGTLEASSEARLQSIRSAC